MPELVEDREPVELALTWRGSGTGLLTHDPIPHGSGDPATTEAMNAGWPDGFDQMPGDLYSVLAWTNSAAAWARRVMPSLSKTVAR